MAKLIGTAGHVDHGKSTLIRALTGIDPDRLPEEKQRGMTIDIGFAYVELPGHGRVSIVDVPGHERFLANMLVGALGIDVALLCVAADESVMPQTREHLQILELLPVDHVVVALTRADAAEPELRELARAEVEELMAGSRFGPSPVLEVSAFTGEGLPELREALARALDQTQRSDSGPWYLPVDRAFIVKGHGTVVTGTLIQGRVRVGDRGVLQPGNVDVRVRSIHSHEQAQEIGERGRRTALNLGGVDLEDVRRGMVLGEPGSVFETSILDAKLTWVGEHKHAQRVRVSIGADEAIGKLFLSSETPEIAQLRLETPVGCAVGQPLIVRRYSPPDLIGGGRVVIPQARPRRRSEGVVLPGEGLTDEDAILRALESSAHGMPTEEICRLLGKTPQALGTVFEKLLSEGRVRGFAGLWMQPGAFREGADRFMEALAKLHESSPTVGAHPREKVVSQAGLKWAGKPLDRILSALSEEGRVVVSGTTVRDAAFRVQLTDRQRQLLDRVLAELGKAEVNTPSAGELATAVHVPIQAVEEILRLGVEAGEVLRLGDGIFYTPVQLAALRSRITALFGSQPFSAAQFRDALGTSRKYAIPLLEYFDSIRFTLRVGDNRHLA